MAKKTRRNYNWLILLIILLVIGLIVWFTIKAVQQDDKKNEDDTPVENVQADISELDELLAKDFIGNYPPTPKEVVKYYAKMTQVLYNEECTEEQIQQIAYQMLLLCDEEFVNNQIEEEYLTILKAEIASYHESGWSITGYALSSSEDVVYSEIDGAEYAQLFCSLTVKELEKTVPINQSYILRKDEEGRYKILGWEMATEEES